MKKVFVTIAIVLLVAVVSVCFVGCTTKADYTVGIVQIVKHEALDAATKGFQDALKAELAKAGKTVKFIYKDAGDDTTVCTTIVNDFVAKKVDLIMANATPALQAAASATESIPILGTSITDYAVALGITNYTGTVGGNISGTSDLAPLNEQAQMMIDLLPDAKNIAFLYCSKEPNSKYQVDIVKKYLEDRGITCKEKPFSETNDLSGIVTSIASEQFDAVYIPTDNTAASNGPTINSILESAKIPVFAGEEGICKKCGFATLSISYNSIGQKTGVMAAKILLGEANISEMPVEFAAATVKKYHKTRAENLGITIPIEYVQIDETPDAE